jgi:hypothetical protein
MRLLSFVKALLAAIFSRGIVVLIFWTVTIVLCVQVMLKGSFVVGFAALVACALCYMAAAGFMGSLIARREKRYRAIDLFGIGALGLIVVAAGLAIMIWSGFSIRLFGVEIGGVAWALTGAFSAVVVVRKEDAIRGDFRG